MATEEFSSTAQHGTTAAHAFFSCNTSNQNLFAVRPGIPAEDALNLASNLLDVARTCAYESSEESNLSGASAYLIEMAKGAIDALVRDIEAGPNGRETAFIFEHLTALNENGVLIINPQAVKHEVDDAKDFLNWASQQAKGGAQ